MRIGRRRPLERVRNHERLRDETAGILEEKLAGPLLVFGVHFLRVVVHVVVPVRDALQAFRQFADVLVEVGNDEAAGAAIDRDVEAELFDRAHDQNEVVQVGHREQRIGARRLDLVDERTGVGEARRIGLEQDDLDALAGCQFAQAVGRRGAERGVLENHRHFRLVAHELRHLQLRLGKLRSARERREGVSAVFVELVGA